jgi:cytosine/adenosine deaminase-related metal-dependent hydrolase
MPLTTHLAESEEEFAMFRQGSGPLYEFMASLKRPMTDCGAATPFSHLWRNGAVDAQWLLVHMNTLLEEDFQLLAELPRGAGPHIVHCPGSHRYFSHPPFPARRLHELGVNLCLGTDSLASTDSLSLFDEMRFFSAAEPWLRPEELLRMVTVNPARALRRRGQLGKIAPGALADLIALPSTSSLGGVYEDVVSYDKPISWMMIDGQIRP